MARQYIVSPLFRGDLTVGTEGDQLKAYFGQVAETGPLRKVFFSGSKEFVTLIIGKRGSGKSHTLGTIVESLATAKDSTSISEHKVRRGVLLLDPMGNFWTTAHEVCADGPSKVREQFASLDGWHCKPEDINVSVYLPAGFKTAQDPDFIKEFRVRVPDLGAADLADLIGINLIKDPQGAALDEAYSAVTEEGWDDGTKRRPANREYRISDLADFLDSLRAHQNGGDHAPTTIKALIRSLRAGAAAGILRFGDATDGPASAGPVGHSDVAVAGGTRFEAGRDASSYPPNPREREEASQIRQRLDIQKLDEPTRTRLEGELAKRIPRSILAIDEAQELLGDEGGEAREALEDFCLLGRNYGLSLLLATQRPTTGAISAKVRSQVDMYVIHRLLTQDDIDTCRANLLAVHPKEIRLGDRELDFAELVRSLEPGQAIVAASYARAEDRIHRYLIIRVRPRVTVHGGEVA